MERKGLSPFSEQVDKRNRHPKSNATRVSFFAKRDLDEGMCHGTKFAFLSFISLSFNRDLSRCSEGEEGEGEGGQKRSSQSAGNAGERVDSERRRYRSR